MTNKSAIQAAYTFCTETKKAHSFPRRVFIYPNPHCRRRCHRDQLFLVQLSSRQHFAPSPLHPNLTALHFLLPRRHFRRRDYHQSASRRNTRNGPALRRCLQRLLTNSSVCPDSPASTVLALRQSASHDAASLALSPAPCLALLSFLEEADIRLSGAQRWFRLHL